MVDAPNELSDKELNLQQLSKHPLEDNISVKRDTDNKVNKLSRKMKNFRISEKNNICLQTNSVDKSADSHQAGPQKSADQNNNKTDQIATTIQYLQNSKSILQDNPTLPDSIRQAIIAKHQRSLGLMDSLQRFKAKNICAAMNTLDINCI